MRNEVSMDSSTVIGRDSPEILFLDLILHIPLCSLLASRCVVRLLYPSYWIVARRNLFGQSLDIFLYSVHGRKRDRLPAVASDDGCGDGSVCLALRRQAELLPCIALRPLLHPPGLLPQNRMLKRTIALDYLI